MTGTEGMFTQTTKLWDGMPEAQRQATFKQVADELLVKHVALPHEVCLYVAVAGITRLPQSRSPKRTFSS